MTNSVPLRPSEPPMIPGATTPPWENRGRTGRSPKGRRGALSFPVNKNVLCFLHKNMRPMWSGNMGPWSQGDRRVRTITQKAEKQRNRQKMFLVVAIVMDIATLRVIMTMVIYIKISGPAAVYDDQMGRVVTGTRGFTNSFSMNIFSTSRPR